MRALLVVNPNASSTSPRTRAVITSALGSSLDLTVATTADYWPLTLAIGERYLLCSDGLTNEVPTEALVALLSAAPGPQVAAVRKLTGDPPENDPVCSPG